MRSSLKQRVLCMLCDATYDPSNAQEFAIHQHPEPQSGVFRMAWLRSGMPYEKWLSTSEGEEWAAYRAGQLPRVERDGSPAQQPPIQPTLILPGEGCRARLTLLNPHNVEVTGEVRVGELRAGDNGPQEWRAIRSYCIPRHIWEAAGRLFEEGV